MKKKILEKIKKLEKEKKIKVLFLIESGSRAWKWESKDSDYDIRGVYVQDYLKVGGINEQIDVINGKLDIVLWDFRKFLKLLMKSNPSVWEWLSSDIVYIESPLRKRLIKIFEKGFSKNALEEHYVSMARQNFEKYINNIGDKANLKKYVYILRSIACVLWIEKCQTPPPKDYRKVAVLLPERIQKFFNKIVKDKVESEDIVGNRDKEAEKFVVSFFDRKFEKTEPCFDEKEIDLIFKKIFRGYQK